VDVRVALPGEMREFHAIDPSGEFYFGKDHRYAVTGLLVRRGLPSLIPFSRATRQPLEVLDLEIPCPVQFS